MHNNQQNGRRKQQQQDGHRQTAYAHAAYLEINCSMFTEKSQATLLVNH